MHRKIAPHRPPCRLYGPPYNSNTNGFFKELNKSLSNITRKYENVLAVGDLNINLLDQKKKKKKIQKITYLTYVILFHSQMLYRDLHKVICMCLD